MLRAASFFVSGWGLLDLDAAEAAAAFEVEGLGAVGGLGAAVAVDASEGGVDAVVDATALGDTYLHAAEAAVDSDDGTVADVGIAQVEAREAEADMHVGSLEGLAVVAVFLLAEGYVNLVLFAAVEDDRDGLLAVVAVAAALLVEEQERQAPHHGDEAEHILPDIVPRDDAACGEEQQYADAAADDGAGLVTVAEDVDETRNDDEQRPPAFEADADDVEEFQGPDDAEGQKGDAADDFAGAFHCVILCCIKISRRF